MNGLILEGIVGSGKTSVLRHILKYIFDQPKSLLVLTEHQTERLLEPLKKADQRLSLDLLHHWLSVIGKFNYAKPDGRCPQNENHEPCFIAERFHFSHCLDLSSGAAFCAYDSVERELMRYKAHIILLTVPEAMITDRSIRSTMEIRGEAWNRYLQTLGSGEEAQADHYRRQQQDFEALAGQSRLPVTMRDTRDMDWKKIAKECVEIIQN